MYFSRSCQPAGVWPLCAALGELPGDRYLMHSWPSAWDACGPSIAQLVKTQAASLSGLVTGRSGAVRASRVHDLRGFARGGPRQALGYCPDALQNCRSISPKYFHRAPSTAAEDFAGHRAPLIIVPVRRRPGPHRPRCQS